MAPAQKSKDRGPQEAQRQEGAQCSMLLETWMGLGGGGEVC